MPSHSSASNLNALLLESSSTASSNKVFLAPVSENGCLTIEEIMNGVYPETDHEEMAGELERDINSFIASHFSRSGVYRSIRAGGLPKDPRISPSSGTLVDLFYSNRFGDPGFGAVHFASRMAVYSVVGNLAYGILVSDKLLSNALGGLIIGAFAGFLSLLSGPSVRLASGNRAACPSCHPIRLSRSLYHFMVIYSAYTVGNMFMHDAQGSDVASDLKALYAGSFIVDVPVRLAIFFLRVLVTMCRAQFQEFNHPMNYPINALLQKFSCCFSSSEPADNLEEPVLNTALGSEDWGDAGNPVFAESPN
jgi:hypothetical protein